jgi:hypothetical protein
LQRGEVASVLVRNNPVFGEFVMNGAESLGRTMVGGGVNVCFANPGTSEMHFVAALDRVDGMPACSAFSKGWSPVPPTAMPG